MLFLSTMYCWFRNFEIFSYPEIQFGIFGYFCRGRNDDESHRTFRCWAHLILSESTHRICIYGSEHGLGIYAWRPSWPCLIAKAHAIRMKFFQPSGYCTLIECAFTFCTTSIFCWLCSITELVKCKLHIHMWGFQITHRRKQCATCQRKNLYDVTNDKEYLNGLNYLGYMIYLLQTTKSPWQILGSFQRAEKLWTMKVTVIFIL